MASNDSMWDDMDDADFLCSDVPEKVPQTTKSTKPKIMKSDTLPPPSERSKRRNAWIAPSFDGFDGFGGGMGSTQPSKPSRKRSRDPEPTQQPLPRTNSMQSRKKPISDETWVDKYAPKTVADLAVHKKKTAEVQGWIEDSLRPKSRSRLCILTGPAGAGKTATVKALVQDMVLSLQEWSNPIPTTSDWSADFVPSRPEFMPIGGGFTNESQSAKFREFLLRANRYPCLQMGAGEVGRERKVILVEEVPNFFSRDLNAFHDIIRQHCQNGLSPVIFILSETASGESAERSLFPKNLQAELNIHNISFNPVAVTSMVKVLHKVASAEASQCSARFTVPDKATLDALCSVSAGDIRGALNALQFVCLKGCSDVLSAVSQSQRADSQSSRQGKSGAKRKQTTIKGQGRGSKKGGKKGDDKEHHLAAIGGRDTSLFLFRALGKILHCKRGDPSDEPTPLRRLPTHLSHHERDPLLIQPEEVVEKCHLSGEYLTSYLHQNYVDFYQELGDVVRASDYLSDSDFLTTNWVGRDVLRGYAAAISSRGIMHANSTRGRYSAGGSSGLGFKPLHKPAWYDTIKKMRANSQDARSLFMEQVHSCPPTELLTQLLPYMSLITKGRGMRPTQGSYLHDVCRFSRKYQVKERLDEKEVDEEGQEEAEDAAVTTGGDESVEVENLAVEVDEEEMQIGDFDD